MHVYQYFIFYCIFHLEICTTDALKERERGIDWEIDKYERIYKDKYEEIKIDR